MSVPSLGWLYFKNESADDSPNHHVPSLAERNIASTEINKSELESNWKNNTDVQPTAFVGQKLTGQEPVNISFEVDDTSDKKSTYVTLVDFQTPSTMSTEFPRKIGSGDKIVKFADEPKQATHLDRSTIYPSKKQPTDSSKSDYMVNLYVGSLTLVGLYIFFRIIEKSK